MDVQLLVTYDCPNEAATAALLRLALNEVGLTDTDVLITVVTSPEQAEKLGCCGWAERSVRAGVCAVRSVGGKPSVRGRHPLRDLCTASSRDTKLAPGQAPRRPARPRLLIEQLLQKDPTGRPATADEVAARLAPIAALPDGGPTQTLTPAAWLEHDLATIQLLAETTRFEPSVPRPPVGVGGGKTTRIRVLAGAVAAAALAGLVALGIRSHSGPTPIAPPSTAAVSPKGRTSSTSPGTSAAVPADPSGTSPAVLTTTKTAPTPHGHGHGHGRH